MEESKKTKEVISPSSSNPSSSIPPFVLGATSKSEEPKDPALPKNDQQAGSSGSSYFSLPSSRPDSDTVQPENATGMSTSHIEEKPVQDPVEEKNTNTMEPQYSEQEKNDQDAVEEKNDQEKQENPTGVPNTGTGSNTNQEQKTSTGPTNTGTSSCKPYVNSSVGVNAGGDGGRSCSSTPRSSRSAQFPGFYDVINTIPLVHDVIRSMAVEVHVNRALFTGTDGQTVRTWHNGHQVEVFDCSTGPVNDIVLQYSNEFIYAFLAHDKGVIKVWKCNVERRSLFRLVRTLQTQWNCLQNFVFPWRDPHQNAISCLCLNDDRNFLYSGSVDHTLNTWRIHNIDYKLVDSIRDEKAAISALTVGPEVVFSGSRDGVIRMWRRELYGRNNDRVRHQLIRMFLIQTQTGPTSVNALAFRATDTSRDWLYAGSSDRKVRCWKNLRIDGPSADKSEPEI